MWRNGWFGRAGGQPGDGNRRRGVFNRRDGNVRRRFALDNDLIDGAIAALRRSLPQADVLVIPGRRDLRLAGKFRY